MAVYPDVLLKIVRHHAITYKDVDEAVKRGLVQWRKQKERREWLEQMEADHFRTMVCDVRHSENVATKKANGEYGKPAKVSMGSAAVNRVVLRGMLDDFYIGSRVLGDIQGKELSALADVEQAKAKGSMNNAKFLRLLDPLVPDEKRVRDAISDEKARDIWNEVVGRRDATRKPSERRKAG